MGMSLLDIKNVNDFAEHFFSGNFIFGDFYKFNDDWKKKFAQKYPKSGILYVNFEHLIHNTEDEVENIAKFLGIPLGDNAMFKIIEIAEGSKRRSHEKPREKVDYKGDFNLDLVSGTSREKW